MTRLPDRDRLQVDRAKIIEYVLNPQHPDGAAKATFFLSRGFSISDWKKFAIALKEHGRSQVVTAREQTAFGDKFIVECTIVTPDGANPCILSVWIVEESRPPRLVTTYPNA
jgi:hypothetical protein